MTGGAWKDTDASVGSKRKKAKQLLRVLTTEHISEDKFRAEVDLADLRIKLRRWNFARGGRRASSDSLADESDAVSPRSRTEDRGNEVTSSGQALSFADRVGGNGSEHDAVGRPSPLLGRHLVGPYLDSCIAATESQLVGARGKAGTRGAVREIQRLAEKVVAQAGLARGR